MRLLLHDCIIPLPCTLTTEERIAFATKIIEEHPLDFQMTDHTVADHKVKIRLDVLGTYILNAVEDIRKDVMSRYKEKRRPFQEMSFSSAKYIGGESVENKIYSNRGEKTYEQ